MSRPTKFDRVSKLITYETGSIPLHISQAKDSTMTIVFNEAEVSEQDLTVIKEKLKTSIPFDTILLRKGEHEYE